MAAALWTKAARSLAIAIRMKAMEMVKSSASELKTVSQMLPNTRSVPAGWGNIMVSGRKSKVSLYNPHIATMEADPTKAYNQDDATGFIRLNALRLKVAAKVHGKKNL